MAKIAYTDKSTGDQVTAADMNQIKSVVNAQDDQVVLNTSNIATLNGDLGALGNEKVDKVTGKNLSTEDYTTAEKIKLSNLSEHFVGRYASLSALQAAHSTGIDGQYGVVDVSGTDAVTYIWDSTDSAWTSGGTGGAVTSVNSQTGAVSLGTDDIGEGSTNKYFNVALVLATALTGFVAGTGHVNIASTDTILASFQKLAGTIADIYSVLSNKVDKVVGKQLSTEDYTTSEKTKLAGIPDGGGSGGGVSLGETSGTAYRGDRGKTAYDHSQLTSGNPHNVTKTDIGLSSVDDTSDADKPISTDTQAALNAKPTLVDGKVDANNLPDFNFSDDDFEIDTETGDLKLKNPGGISVDETIVENSTNAVSGGAVYTALSGKANTSHSHTIADISLLQGDLNAIYDRLTALEAGGGNTTPDGPTDFVVDDTEKTAGFTVDPAYTDLTDYEFSEDSGATWSDVTVNPIPITPPKSVGVVSIRVKAATGRNASLSISNATAFTETVVGRLILVDCTDADNLVTEGFWNEIGADIAPANFVDSAGADTGMQFAITSADTRLGFDTTTPVVPENPEWPDTIVHRCWSLVPDAHVTADLSGFNPAYTYDITVYLLCRGNGNCTIIWNDQSQTLSSNEPPAIVTYPGLIPSSEGVITLDIQGEAGSGDFGTLNAFKIQENII